MTDIDENSPTINIDQFNVYHLTEIISRADSESASLNLRTRLEAVTERANRKTRRQADAILLPEQLEFKIPFFQRSSMYLYPSFCINLLHQYLKIELSPPGLQLLYPVHATPAALFVRQDQLQI